MDDSKEKAVTAIITNKPDNTEIKPFESKFVGQGRFDTDPQQALLDVTGLSEILRKDDPQLKKIDFTDEKEINNLLMFFPEAAITNSDEQSQYNDSIQRVKQELQEATLDQLIKLTYVKDNISSYGRMIFPHLRKTSDTFFPKHPEIEKLIRSSYLQTESSSDSDLIPSLIETYGDPAVVLSIINRVLNESSANQHQEITNVDAPLANELKNLLITETFANPKLAIFLSQLGNSDGVKFYKHTQPDGTVELIKIASAPWTNIEDNEVLIRQKSPDGALHQKKITLTKAGKMTDYGLPLSVSAGYETHALDQTIVHENGKFIAKDVEK